MKELALQKPRGQSSSSTHGLHDPPASETQLPARCEQVGTPRLESKTSHIVAVPQGQLLAKGSHTTVQILSPLASLAQT